MNAAADQLGLVLIRVESRGAVDIGPTLSHYTNGTVVEVALVGAGSTSGVYINEGDCITFTPSGGGGASIPGAFALVIRSQS